MAASFRIKVLRLVALSSIRNESATCYERVSEIECTKIYQLTMYIFGRIRRHTISAITPPLNSQQYKGKINLIWNY